MARRINCLVALLIVGFGQPIYPAASPPLSVCAVSQRAPDYVGKRVRVEGYVFDLSSHGFVLVSKKDCKTRGQLGLALEKVWGNPLWKSAFADSMGPKRSVLIGVIRWERAQSGGQRPILAVERIESIAANESRLSDFE